MISTANLHTYNLTYKTHDDFCFFEIIILTFSIQT
jgi:hypothetical protein